ncbi:MAG: NAD-dependent succinate-semialdehyde dehydrogenase [Chitinophagaceae bacterium]
MNLVSINPFDGKLLRNYREDSEKQVTESVQKAQRSFLNWKNETLITRGQVLINCASYLRKQKKDLAILMAMEMGKPIQQGVAEIEKCAWVCEFYAENAGHFLLPEKISTDGAKSYVCFEPLGVILSVMPWNFPFWQVFRFLAPALMSGNSALLKHASNVSGCALAIEKIVNLSGAPKNLFKSLIINSFRVGQVIENPVVKAISLTGSTAAGKMIAAKAGSLLKKVVLELGGSDPYLVLADADLKQAARLCADSRLINSGQSCIAAKRFILDKKIESEFLKYFQENFSQKRVGNPLEKETEIGPLARLDLRKQLHQQVKKSVSLGARCVIGGNIPSGPGFFYPPTILTNVKKGMPAYGEELFGPVAAVMSFRNEKTAIKTANDSIYGLGSAVFTKDIQRGEIIASENLDAGSCFVNASVRSDPRMPFGGIKQSGFGRELGSFGIREFVNIKSIYIK